MAMKFIQKCIYVNLLKYSETPKWLINRMKYVNKEGYCEAINFIEKYKK